MYKFIKYIILFFLVLTQLYSKINWENQIEEMKFSDLTIFNNLMDAHGKYFLFYYGKNLNNIEGKMLTLLTLSFWCVLFENNSLWCHSLYLVFPKKVRQENSIRAINMKLKDILRLRNKIAHHERIVHKKGTAIYKTVEDIKLILNWLIENDDDEFYQYIKCFIDSKMEEIKNLLVR